MSIQLLFILTLLIPEVKGRSKSEIMSLVESARQSSIPRIKKYAGYVFVASFFFPPALFSSVYIKWGCTPGEVYFVFIGAIGLLSVLTSYLLTSIFNPLILKPAIYDQLNKEPQHPKPSA